MATVSGGIFDTPVVSDDGSDVTVSQLLTNFIPDLTGLESGPTGSEPVEIGGSRAVVELLNVLTTGTEVKVQTQGANTVITGKTTSSTGAEVNNAAASFGGETGEQGTAELNLGGTKSVAVTAGSGTTVTGRSTQAQNTADATQAAQEQILQSVNNSSSSGGTGLSDAEVSRLLLLSAKLTETAFTKVTVTNGTTVIDDTTPTTTVNLDYLSLGNSRTVIVAGSGSAGVVGGDGADSILGGSGADTVTGGSGNDVISGGIGDDLVFGLSAGLDGSPDAGRATGDITVVGAANEEGSSTVTMLDIFDVLSGTSVNISQMDNVLIMGDGQVVVTDDVDATIYGDSNDQVIVGGEGNDTLVGGGGNDSLVGGAGENTFGFESLGNFVIQDFGAGEDLISFGDAGLQSLEDLAMILTGAADVDGNAVFTFFSGENTTTITIVGMSVNDITADMVNFDL